MTKLTTAATLAAFIVAGAGTVWAQQAPAPGGPAAPPVKLTAAECQAIWNKADAAKSGSLSMAQAQPYVTDFKAVDSNGDSKLSASEFQAGCLKGQAHDSASTGAGSGSTGKDRDPSTKY